MTMRKNGATPSASSVSVGCRFHITTNIAISVTSAWIAGTIASVTSVLTHHESPVTREMRSPTGLRW